MFPRFSSLRLPSGNALGARSNGRIHGERRRIVVLLRRKEFGTTGSPSHDTARLSSRVRGRKIAYFSLVARLQRCGITRIPSVRSKGRARAPLFMVLLWHLWQPLANTRRENPRSARCFMYARFPPLFHLFVMLRILESSPLLRFARITLPLPDLLTLVDLCSHYPTRRDLFELIRAILPLPAFRVHAL